MTNVPPTLRGSHSLYLILMDSALQHIKPGVPEHQVSGTSSPHLSNETGVRDSVSYADITGTYHRNLLRCEAAGSRGHSSPESIPPEPGLGGNKAVEQGRIQALPQL